MGVVEQSESSELRREGAGAVRSQTNGGGSSEATALREALACVDILDFEGLIAGGLTASLATCGEDEQASTDASIDNAPDYARSSKRESPSKRSRRTAVRRRLDLARLSRLAQGLDQTVRRLRAARDNTAAASTSAPTDTCEGSMRRFARYLHHSLCRDAMRENVALKRRIRDNVELMDAMQRVLAVVKAPVEKPPCRLRLAEQSEADSRAFADLMELLHQQYKETHGLLADQDNSHVESVVTEDGGTFTTREYTALPFVYDVCAAAFWAALGEFVGDDEMTHSLTNGATIDTVKVDIGVAVRLPRRQGLVDMKMALRRVTEATRTVLLWCSVCNPDEIRRRRVASSVRVFHKGWAVLEPKATSTSSNPVTSVRIFTKTSPEFAASRVHVPRQVQTVLRSLERVHAVERHACLQRTENKLLERAIGF